MKIFDCVKVSYFKNGRSHTYVWEHWFILFLHQPVHQMCEKNHSYNRCLSGSLASMLQNTWVHSKVHQGDTWGLRHNSAHQVCWPILSLVFSYRKDWGQRNVHHFIFRRNVSKRMGSLHSWKSVPFCERLQSETCNQRKRFGGWKWSFWMKPDLTFLRLLRSLRPYLYFLMSLPNSCHYACSCSFCERSYHCNAGTKSGIDATFLKLGLDKEGQEWIVFLITCLQMRIEFQLNRFLFPNHVRVLHQL